jgi:hypothetical protein
MVCGSAHTHTHTLCNHGAREGWEEDADGVTRCQEKRANLALANHGQHARLQCVFLGLFHLGARLGWRHRGWVDGVGRHGARVCGGRMPRLRTTHALSPPDCLCIRPPLRGFTRGGGSSSECCATRRVPSSATSPTTTAPIKTVLYTCATVGGLLYPLPLACTHDMHPHRWRCHSVQAPRTHVRRVCDGMLASEGTRPPRGAENGGLIVVVALTMRPRVCCLLTYPRVCACAVSRAGGRSHLSEETGKPPLLRLKTVSRETSLTVSVLRCSGLPSRCDPPSARVFHTVPLVSTHPPPIVVSSHPPSSREEGEARLRVGDVRRRRLVIKRYPPSTIHTCPCVCIRSACSDVVVRLRSRRMDGCGMWPTPTPSLPPWKSVPVKASPSAGGGDALSVCHTLSRPSRG